MDNNFSSAFLRNYFVTLSKKNVFLESLFASVGYGPKQARSFYENQAQTQAEKHDPIRNSAATLSIILVGKSNRILIKFFALKSSHTVKNYL